MIHSSLKWAVFYLLAVFIPIYVGAADRPNIVLIMADDIGVEGLGCYGGTSYKTPRLDEMAAKGMRYTRAYSQPLCSPTRIQIMTGEYNHRNWTYFGCLDPNEKTFGHFFQEAGYKTCIAGKWQLTSYDPPDYPGSELRRNRGMHPSKAGFDTWSLFHAEHTEDKGSRYANPTIIEDGKLRGDTDGKYGEDISVDVIADFLDENRDQSNFVYYPMALPHWPVVPTPDSEVWSDKSRRLEEDLAYFPDMVEYMDTIVGRLVDRIDELGLAENTLILFYSDNGTDKQVTSMRNGKEVPGGKGATSQNGIHVPLIAYWPGKVPAGTCGDIIDASDFVPTLCEIAGIEPQAEWNLDGKSFAPTLFGKENPEAREWAFFWYDPRPGWDKDQFTLSVFALDEKFKLYTDGSIYNIVDDPLEKKQVRFWDLDAEERKAIDKLRSAIEDTLVPQ